MTAADVPDPALLAIIAHGLLSDASVIGTAAGMLEELDDTLGPELRARLLAMIVQHSDHVSEVLNGLARGLPLDTLLTVTDPHDLP